MATKELNRVYSHKPAGTRLQRQISRMIKYLIEQYHTDDPLYAMPSSWLIDELVINAAKNYTLQSANWQLQVHMTLKQIIQDTSYKGCNYINSRNNTPLFPNNELFDTCEIHLAMKALLNFLISSE